jgi:hypothetical protein
MLALSRYCLEYQDRRAVAKRCAAAKAGMFGI